MRILVLLSLLLTTNLFAQVEGKMFPDLEGETYDGQKVNLPGDAKGKMSLIGMAYSKKSEPILKTWLSPVYNKFIAKSGMFDDLYDVNMYFVPMFVGTNQATAGSAKKKLKEQTEAIFHPHVVFYQGALKQYKQALAFEKKDTAYLFVLDEEGKIVYATSGSFSEEKMEKIEDVLID